MHWHQPFIVIVDAAPCHVSAECRAQVKRKMPWVLHAYVAAGYTSVAQPLDRAYMRPLKCVLKRAAASQQDLCGGLPS
eukprot:2016138-Amphidinium_carterae.1